MRKITNYSGRRFGRLVVVSDYRIGRPRMVSCVCDCGNKLNVYLSNLFSGHTTSCGCYNLEVVKKLFKTHGQCNKTSEHKAWAGMKERCYNPKIKNYRNYGARGITVCERWLHSFENFFEDMGKKPSPRHSLDRFPDANGNYEPNNCRWATSKQQNGNRTNNVWIEYNGDRKILMDWASELGISRSTISLRLKKGQTMDEIARWSKIFTSSRSYASG